MKTEWVFSFLSTSRSDGEALFAATLSVIGFKHGVQHGHHVLFEDTGDVHQRGGEVVRC